MSQHVKTSKSVYITLAAGFALGAVTIISISGGQAIGQSGNSDRQNSRLISSSTTESMSELKSEDASYKALARFVAPAVVDIRTEATRSATADGARMPEAVGEGSGFVFRADGYIVTNEHVVGDAQTVKVTFSDGRELTGKVTKANDANSDIALVKVDAKDLPTLSFADSNQVEPGQIVMAVGAPFGFKNTVTVGHVSALGRNDTIGQIGKERYYSDMIQTDAAINMGNSGGPLVNVDGQVVGINTAIFSPTGTSNGIGFAIPSNQAKLITDILISKGKLTRSMLGLVPEDLKEFQKKDMNLPQGGAIVREVVGEPATSAGFQKNDIVTKIGSVPVHSQIDLRNAMLRYAPGSEVNIEFIRDGAKKTKTVKLLEYKLPRELAQQVPAKGSDKLPNGHPRIFDMDPFNDPQLKGFPNLRDDDDSSNVPQLREGQAQLGVQVVDINDQIRTQFHIPANVKGAVVMNVTGSVASRLRLQPGDVITALGDKQITNAQELANAMKGVNWGSRKRIKFARFGSGSQFSMDTIVTFR